MDTHTHRSRGRIIIDKKQKVFVGRKPVEKYATQMYAYIVLKQDVEDVPHRYLWCKLGLLPITLYRKIFLPVALAMQSVL